MILHSKKHIRDAMGAAICAVLLLVFTAGAAAAANAPVVTYKNGLLNLQADKSPLLDILSAISGAAGINVMVSRDFVPAELSIRFTDQPLEAALKRILASCNHTVFYQKKDGSFKVSEIRVYPKGTDSGPLRALAVRGTAPENDPAGFKPLPASDMPVGRGRFAGQAGLLTPGSYSGSQQSERVAVMGQQFEIEEQKAFAEIEELQKQMDMTGNTAEREALQIVYMDKLAAFENLQRRNQNRLEAMHRIELFENSRKKNEQ